MPLSPMLSTANLASSLDGGVAGGLSAVAGLTPRGGIASFGPRYSGSFTSDGFYGNSYPALPPPTYQQPSNYYQQPYQQEYQFQPSYMPPAYGNYSSYVPPIFSPETGGFGFSSDGFVQQCVALSAVKEQLDEEEEEELVVKIPEKENWKVEHKAKESIDSSSPLFQTPGANSPRSPLRSPYLRAIDQNVAPGNLSRSLKFFKTPQIVKTGGSHEATNDPSETGHDVENSMFKPPKNSNKVWTNPCMCGSRERQLTPANRF